MKKLVTMIAAMAAALVVGSAGAGDWSKIRIGVEGAYPPFSSVTPDGKLVGFDIDIAHALCEAMGAECELVIQDWDGMIPALLARKFDAIVASMSITEERKKKVAFTDKYYNTPARFVARKGANIEISKAGLKGKTVGVQRGTVSDNFITGEFTDVVDIKRYATQEEAYLDLVAGRLDLIFADAVVVDGGFLKTDKGKDFEFVGPTYTDPKYFGEGIGIAVRKGDQDLVEKFNEAIRTIRANGKYKEINDKYFDFDVYGDS